MVKSNDVHKEVADANASLPLVVSAEELIPEFDPADPTTRTGYITLSSVEGERLALVFSGVTGSELPSGTFRLKSISVLPQTELTYFFQLTTDVPGSHYIRALGFKTRKSGGIFVA